MSRVTVQIDPRPGPAPEPPKPSKPRKAEPQEAQK